MNDYLPLGARVTFSSLSVLRRQQRQEMHPAYRYYRTDTEPPTYLQTVKRWMRTGETYGWEVGSDKDELMHGVIVGVRTKFSGYVEGGYYEDPATFVPVEAHRVYLAAVDLHKNPVCLFLGDVTMEWAVLT